MTITASAGVLACHVEGSGPPLVLFHGGMGSWTHWARNIPALRSRFTIHAPDLPGCGDSLAVPQEIAKDDYDTRVFSLAPHTLVALPVIAAPTLLIYGERDNLAFPSVQARIDVCRAHKADIRAETIPNAGHWVQYEAAQAVNRLLVDFFARAQGEP